MSVALQANTKAGSESQLRLAQGCNLILDTPFSLQRGIYGVMKRCDCNELSCHSKLSIVQELGGSPGELVAGAQERFPLWGHNKRYVFILQTDM